MVLIELERFRFHSLWEIPNLDTGVDPKMELAPITEDKDSQSLL